MASASLVPQLEFLSLFRQLAHGTLAGSVTLRLELHQVVETNPSVLACTRTPIRNNRKSQYSKRTSAVYRLAIDRLLIMVPRGSNMAVGVGGLSAQRSWDAMKPAHFTSSKGAVCGSQQGRSAGLNPRLW
jgi:hypothetical protein